MRIRLCVNTQTPLVRFKASYSELRERLNYQSGVVKLEELEQGSDYEYTPGGVAGMVHAALRRMLKTGLVSDASWISLGPGAPSEVVTGHIRLYNLSLEEKQLLLYANFKEGIWKEIHGLGKLAFNPAEYQAYAEYNWLCARRMLDMLHEVDLFWVHDFQQLLIGGLIGPSAPVVFRWHIPFRLDEVSLRLRTLILKSIASFDSIIVSSKRDLEGLIRAGYSGPVSAVYPYLDPAEWSAPSRSAISAVKARLGIGAGDRLLLVVGRMDPVKNQDVAIRAMARVAKRYPEARLLLVGNGSFTSSQRGGLRNPKAQLWGDHLRRIVHALRLGRRVIFAGHVNHVELNALYGIAEAVLVPSRIEGFNLTPVEGWLHKKPCIVSNGAGSSELVQDGVNGYAFSSGVEEEFSDKVSQLLESGDRAHKMGENGAMTARLCSIDAAVTSLKETFEGALRAYR
ncbi:MAG: glycosyltransferase family 4 protein [Nitrososphaerota archaeon]|nr:glycosyltransferase family 4 protein [Nitrososphaerota archaeon]